MGRRPVVLPHLPHRRAYLFVPYPSRLARATSSNASTTNPASSSIRRPSCCASPATPLFRAALGRPSTSITPPSTTVIRDPVDAAFRLLVVAASALVVRLIVRAWLETTTLDAGDIITIERPTRANSGPVSSTSTHAVRALRLGPRRLCILAECIRLLSGRCGANLADVRCPGRRGRGFPGRSLRDVHPSRRWCVRSIRLRAWFRRVLHRSWPCA